MTNKTFENCTLLDTFTWFQKARPDVSDQDRNSQLGVHLEEVSEMLEALGAANPEAQFLLDHAHNAVKGLADFIKANSSENLIVVEDADLFLDSLCDQIVTATGVGYTQRFDVVGAMTEVNRSNFSKFDEAGNPIRNENGKIMKGPLYSKADLSPYLPQ